jgi:hypothetical protein
MAEALRLPWSNGMVEGQIHCLKLINRQMYGRGSFELLRLRVLSQDDSKAWKDDPRTLYPDIRFTKSEPKFK